VKKPLLLFAVVAVLLWGAVGWISVTALRLEEAEAEARRRASVEESVRLALWRMDSALVPVLAREREEGPLLAPVLLRFRLAADGVLSVRGQTPDEAAGGVEARRQHLADILARSSLERALPAAQAVQRQVSDSKAQTSKLFDDNQAYRNSLEWQARAKTASSAGYGASLRPRPMLVPIWAGGELMLVRRGEDGTLEGSWLDWAAIQGWLASEVRDLLPSARLEPVIAHSLDDGDRRLASLPARLLPGPVIVPAAGGASLRTVLAVAWTGVLLATGAVLLLLTGTAALAERRATFVSAVTHELRTPLTTLRTYAEMLADGKIESPEKRARYLETLHREAVRLGHLVENVLSWARIEKGRGGERRERVEVAPLFLHLRERLEGRAEAAGMRLELDPGPEGLAVLADPAAVEQILFNLVDNACKYAAAGAEAEVRVSAAAEGGRVAIRVVDRGPGIPADARARLFQPFSRSAEQAAGAAPGVGLGLALCRRLARALGGDLLVEPGEGARFVLRLPS
jgi:signal transduction histidine kinase